MGFRSRNPEALTLAERQLKWRRVHGVIQLTFPMTAETRADLLYIRREWGMRSDRQAVEAALRFLALLTRGGLQRLPQTMDD